MIRIGVAGCGKIAQVRHLPEYEARADVQICGLFDLNQERTQALAEQYGATAYATYEDMLADPQIDAISVCSANVAHADMTVALSLLPEKVAYVLLVSKKRAHDGSPDGLQ